MASALGSSPVHCPQLWHHPEGNTLLGKGTFGRVYASENPVTGSPWAVKVGREEDEMELSQWEHLVLTERLPNAPSTVRVRALYSTAEKTSLAMQRLPSPDLWRMCWKYPKQFTFAVFCDIARQGLEALTHYRKRGVAHSDIKLPNCSYDFATRQFTIFDFGTAFLPGEGVWTNGTVGYRAPEILLEDNPSYGIDMWAFGATLFELYTGTSFLLNRNQKRCDHQDELYWAFRAQLGDPFVKYVGQLFLKEIQSSLCDGPEAQWSEDQLMEIGKGKLLALIGKEDAKPPTPWREVIAATARQKGEEEHAAWTIQFLERIFVCGESRMTPEEGLSMIRVQEGPRSLSGRATPDWMSLSFTPTPSSSFLEGLESDDAFGDEGPPLTVIHLLRQLDQS